MATSKSKAPAKKPVQEEQAPAFEVGQVVRFLGYPEGTAEEDRHLEEGGEYEIVSISEPDGEEGAEDYSPGGNPVLSFPNPDFNAKKKESEDNPKTYEVEVLPEEIELVADEEPAAEEAAPKAAAKTAIKGKAAAAAAPAKAEKGKKDAKTPAKAAPAKGAKKKAEKVEKEPEVDPLDLDLEHEDESVLALIQSNEDLIALAQELEAESTAKFWQLGGVLYHLRKDKSYTQVEGGDAYKEAGGFEKFVNDFFNIGYRVAMHWIKIYHAFNTMQVENAAQKVAEIGWTKAKTIAPAMLEEGANVEELLELAGGNTVEELSEAIRDTTRVGGTAGVKVARLTLKFRYVEEEAKVIDSILNTAKDQLGLKKVEEALQHIVIDWANQNAGGTATKAAAPVQKAAAAKTVSKPAAKTAAPAAAKTTTKPVARRVTA